MELLQSQWIQGRGWYEGLRSGAHVLEGVHSRQVVTHRGWAYPQREEGAGMKFRVIYNLGAEF